jgi:hypothetical protein
VSLWSVCLVMVVIRPGVDVLGAASNFGRTTGLEVSQKGKVEVDFGASHSPRGGAATLLNPVPATEATG